MTVTRRTRGRNGVAPNERHAGPARNGRSDDDERPRRASALERASTAAAKGTGSGAAFAIAFALIVVWFATGPLFHWSDTWQLVINTTTTIVTFLMVFLIQRAQNRDALAMSLKLDELIAATEGASNRLLGTDQLSERDLDVLRAHFAQLVELSRADVSLTASHSVEEAATRHELKSRSKRRR